MSIADRLRQAGYTVIEATGAEEALDVLARSFDVKLVLSDVQMPGSMDGTDLARFVRATYPAIRIVLTSGHSLAMNETEHDGFFPKPCDIVRLIRHIAALLD